MTRQEMRENVASALIIAYIDAFERDGLDYLKALYMAEAALQRIEKEGMLPPLVSMKKGSGSYWENK
jgi:TPP-dependent pyruvate/acetoin dehydrogenase alpha subunit